MHVKYNVGTVAPILGNRCYSPVSIYLTTL